MDKNIRQYVLFIKANLERIAITAVKSIRENLYRVEITNPTVTVKNPVRKVDVNGTVIVANQKKVEERLDALKKPLSGITEAIRHIIIPTAITVKNLSDIPKPEKIVIPDSVTIKNPQRVVSITNLKKVEQYLSDLIKSLETLPDRMPKVPPAQIQTISSHGSGGGAGGTNSPIVMKDPIDMRSDDPKRYVPVRLSDGDKFYDAINKFVESVTGGSRHVFQKPDGARGAALMDEQNHADVVQQDKYGLNNTEKNGNTTYLGQEDASGNWYVEKIVKTTVGSVTTTAEYHATHANNPTKNTYTGAWNYHTSLTYGRYSEAF